MTFAGFHRVIKENDTVILYIGIEDMHALEVKKTLRNKHGAEVPNTFQTRYGALQVMSLVGREFGSRVQLSKGWAVVLYPTPELWTLTLPHRTQILYTTDISMVLGRLNVGPGSVVCEAGTGSGSLSHAFLRALGPTGRLHTADFHKERVEAARDEFTRHGLEGRVTICQRDVIDEGWQVEGVADAVFLDMPRPWGALHHAVNAIKVTGGRICSFSPCIEQVSRSSTAMRQLGLQCIRTIEVLTRELQIKQIDMPIINIQKEERSEKKENISENGSEIDETPTSKKIKLDSEPESPQDNVSEPNNNSEVDIAMPENSAASAVDSGANGSAQLKVTAKAAPAKYENLLSTLPLRKQAGHTGYLTFCIVPPGVPRPATAVKVD